MLKCIGGKCFGILKKALQSAYIKGNNIFASEFLTFIRANIYTKTKQKLDFWKIY